MTSKQSFKTTP